MPTDYNMKAEVGEFINTLSFGKTTDVSAPAGKSSLNFALDFDETYSRDPTFWKDFVALTSSYGHTVDIVTMRHEEVDKLACEDELYRNGIKNIVYVGGKDGGGAPKMDTVAERGLKYDIWIDDNPKALTNGSDFVGQKIIDWRLNDKHRATPYRP